MNEHQQNNIKGSDLIVKLLVDNGVRYVFGLLGDIETDIARSLSESPIQFIGARNEKCATFMADIYSRIKRTPGICLSTVGPGATNLVSGLANSTADRSSVIAISDQLPTTERGIAHHQYIDYAKLFDPSSGVVKWSHTLEWIADAPHIFERAFTECTTEPAGAVHIGIPVDLLKQNYQGGTEQTVARPSFIPPDIENTINSTHERIATGNGIIFAGGHAKRLIDPDVFKLFVERSSLPVVTSFMGKGIFDERHPLSLGTISRHLEQVYSPLFKSANFVLAIGYDFTEGVKSAVFGNNSKIVNLNGFDNRVDGFYQPAENLFCDLDHALSTLAERKFTRDTLAIEPVRKSIRDAVQLELSMDVYPPRPHRIMDAVNTVFGDNSTIICDVGLNKYYAGLLIQAKATNQLLFSNGMSSMAFSSGALAAKLAAPEKDVLAITGDGGFLMDPQELSTCVNYNIPLTVLVLNNSGLGLVEKKQRKDFGRAYESTFCSPDYPKLAEAFGAKGYLVRSHRQLTDILGEARANGKVNVIEVPVNYSEGI